MGPPHKLIAALYGAAIAFLIMAIVVLVTSCGTRDPNRDFSNLKRLSDSVENAEKAGDYYGR